MSKFGCFLLLFFFSLSGVASPIYKFGFLPLPVSYIDYLGLDIFNLSESENTKEFNLVKDRERRCSESDIEVSQITKRILTAKYPKNIFKHIPPSRPLDQFNTILDRQNGVVDIKAISGATYGDYGFSQGLLWNPGS